MSTNRQKGKNPKFETSSRSVTPSDTAVHKYHVTNFSKLLDGSMDTSKFVCSQRFTAGGRSWTIRVFPDGVKEENNRAGEVSVYLYLADGAKDAKTNFTLSLYFKNSCNIVVKSAKHIFPEVSAAWGFSDFIKKTSLKKLLKSSGDSFTIKCDLTVIGESHSVNAAGTSG